MTSLFIEVIAFVSIVPTTLLTLVLLAGTSVTNGKTPIFLSKTSFPCESNLG